MVQREVEKLNMEEEQLGQAEANVMRSDLDVEPQYCSCSIGISAEEKEQPYNLVGMRGCPEDSFRNVSCSVLLM